MNQLGMTHLSFRVEGIDGVLAKLEAAGGRVLEGSVLALGDGSSKALMAVDPDGTRLEIIDAPGDPNAVPGSE
jgi:lactoylglutathione lyase